MMSKAIGSSLLVCLFSVMLTDAVLAQTKPPPPARKEIVEAAPSDSAIAGSFEGNTYSNKYFGFRIQVPEKYVVLNRQEIDLFTAAGADMFKGENRKENREIDEAVGRTRQLLVISKLPPGSVGNAALEIAIVKQGPGITSRMVLAESVRVLTLSGKAKLKAYSADRKLGGRTFSVAELESEFAGQVLKQKFFVTMIRGYAFTLAATYTTPETLTAFDEMFESISWNNK